MMMPDIDQMRAKEGYEDLHRELGNLYRTFGEEMFLHAIAFWMEFIKTESQEFIEEWLEYESHSN